MLVLNDMKIALVSDELTYWCIKGEGLGRVLSPLNAWRKLLFGKSDVLFVESAWQGHKNRWKYKVAAYPDHPERNNRMLVELVEFARDRGIPTVFWNKEDGVHFDRFIDSAKHFDHIFTVDENCIPRYRAVVPETTTVDALPFAVQPRFHHFTGFNFQKMRACFVGSYSHHIHEERRERQNFLLQAANDVLGVDIYNRNSNRKAAHYRFPEGDAVRIFSAVSYPVTADLYREYLISLNVNTVTDSPTMYSRRLVEIIACGGIAVTTPALSVDKLFKEYCYVVDSYDEAHELFSRLKAGPSSEDLERARAGARYVAHEHTWEKRLQKIGGVVGLK